MMADVRKVMQEMMVMRVIRVMKVSVYVHVRQNHIAHHHSSVVVWMSLDDMNHRPQLTHPSHTQTHHHKHHPHSAHRVHPLCHACHESHEIHVCHVCHVSVWLGEPQRGQGPSSQHHNRRCL